MEPVCDCVYVCFVTFVGTLIKSLQDLQSRNNISIWRRCSAYYCMDVCVVLTHRSFQTFAESEQQQREPTYTAHAVSTAFETHPIVRATHTLPPSSRTYLLQNAEKVVCVGGYGVSVCE